MTPSFRCPWCHQVIPGNQWMAHQQKHKTARRPVERQGSSAKWKRLRLLILARDNKRCQDCGTTEHLEVHHVDGDWRNDRPDNLITLCTECHALLKAAR